MKKKISILLAVTLLLLGTMNVFANDTSNEKLNVMSNSETSSASLMYNYKTTSTCGGYISWYADHGPYGVDMEGTCPKCGQLWGYEGNTTGRNGTTYWVAYGYAKLTPNDSHLTYCINTITTNHSDEIGTLVYKTYRENYYDTDKGILALRCEDTSANDVSATYSIDGATYLRTEIQDGKEWTLYSIPIASKNYSVITTVNGKSCTNTISTITENINYWGYAGDKAIKKITVCNDSGELKEVTASKYQ